MLRITQRHLKVGRQACFVMTLSFTMIELGSVDLPDAHIGG